MWIHPLHLLVLTLLPVAGPLEPGAVPASPLAAQDRVPREVPVPMPLPGPAQDHEEDEPDPAYDALFGRYGAAMDARFNQVKALRRQGVSPEAFPPSPDVEYLPRFIELAEEGSGRANLWILDRLPPVKDASEEQLALARRCLRRLVEDHGDTYFVLQAFPHLTQRSRYVSVELALELLEHLAEHSQNAEVAGRAYYEQAMVLSDGLQTEDPELLEQARELLRIAVDGFSGTRGAVFAADRFFTRSRIKLWADVVAWSELVQSLHSQGLPVAEWPTFPAHTAHSDFLVLAQAGHPLAHQWSEVVFPAFLQAERRSPQEGWFEFAESIARHHHAGLRAAMDARFAIFGMLIATQPDGPLMFDIVESLQIGVHQFPLERYAPLLEDLVQRTSDDDVRHQALYTLAQSLQRTNREELILRAAEVYERISREAPSERMRREADLTLRDLRRLLPGAPAPELVTPDSEGFPITLSDYRGKVVLLAYWGFWNPGVEEFLAGLNELHDTFSDRPFAIIGFNTDLREPRGFRLEMHERGVFWRNSLQQMRSGPAADAFEVRTYPFLLLIDAEGIQQGRGLSLEGLAERIEEHVRRAEEQEPEQESESESDQVQKAARSKGER